MTDLDDDHPAPPHQVALYLLGALDADGEAAFERHLAGCAPCQDESDRLGPLLTGMSRLGVDEVDPGAAPTRS
ncbi:zf-HC2 domain-containing protein [Micromonospora sp. NPDC050397]|uniref:zf-HC2 domain-containing protein n=1 Tax=Micromonospora sp. NPDC050397 TaxID=3364279 RepID=UPI00384F997A